MAVSEAVNDSPLQNPISNPSIPISDPPENPSYSPSQQPPPPSTESMPPPYTSAPVSIPAPAAVPLSPKSKKRAQIQDSGYFKIRAVVKEMRPHLLEVIQPADFRDCKAADELRERLKLLMELYKQMTAEGVTITKCRNASENGASQKTEQLPADNREAIDVEEQSCYIGGSAFGWNFTMFASNKAVYYGRTKESFRAAQAASHSLSFAVS